MRPSVMLSLLLPTPLIHKLPVELLGEIFFIVCDKDKDINVLDCNGQFWILQQVCVPWRNIARNTPLLWSCIRLEDCHFRCKLPVALARTKLCLERSRKVPLSVILRISPNEAIDTTIRKIVSALTLHVGRWKHLRLNHSSLSVMEGRGGASNAPQTLIQPGQLKGLQSFVFIGNPDPGHYDMLDWRMFCGADALQDVKLYNCYLPRASEFPWRSLKRLTVRECKSCGSSPTGYDIEALFRALSNLEELEWKLRTASVSPRISSVVTFQYLHHISIEYTRHVAMIMPMLRFPRLTDLGVVYSSEPVHGNIVNTGPILSMLKVSGCIIKSLHLSMGSDTATLLQILEFTEHVESLNLLISPKMEHSQEIISHLVWNPAPDSKGSTLLPYLRRLEVQFFDHELYSTEQFDVYVDGMMDIMDSRRCSADLLGGDDQGREWPLGELQLVTSTFDIPYYLYDYCEARMPELERFGFDCGISVDVELYEVSYSSSEDSE